MTRHLTTGLLVLPAAALLLCGCTTNDYDLNDVDTTIAVGGDITLPTGSNTQDITLGDILDIDDSDCISLDAADDYVFRQTGDPIDPIHAEVGRISVGEALPTQSYALHIPVADYIPDVPAGVQLPDIKLPQAVTVPGRVNMFTFRGSHPAEVLQLTHATGHASIALRITFSAALAAVLPELDAVELDLPDQLVLDKPAELKDSQWDGTTNTIRLSNVQTAAALTLSSQLTGLRHFTTSEPDGDADYLAFTDTEVALRGTANLSITFSRLNASAFAANADYSVSSALALSQITITGATGRFNPAIDLHDVGNVTVSSVPDFLDDDEVTIDLYNPQLTLTVANDLTVPARIKNARLTSTDKSGNTIGDVTIDEAIRLPHSTDGNSHNTRILLCRTTDGIDLAAYDQVIAQPNLHTLLSRVPRHLSFSCTAEADPTVTATFELGRQYTLQPTYAFEAPLAFGENTTIVYSDSVNNLNKDLDDINIVSGKTQIEVSADMVSTLPLQIDVEAYAVDTQHRRISSSDLRVETVVSLPACADTRQPVSGTLRATVQQLRDGAMKRVDAIIFKARASSTAQTKGIRLNATTQTLRLSNITARVTGKVIVNEDND